MVVLASTAAVLWQLPFPELLHTSVGFCIRAGALVAVVSDLGRLELIQRREAPRVLHNLVRAGSCFWLHNVGDPGSGPSS